jgi:hypothetical protein
MKTWSMSINDGKAELEVPPDGLIATLMPSKAGTFNPLRSGATAKSQNSNSSSESTFPNIATPGHPMPPYPPYHGLPPYYYNPYTPPPAPIQQLCHPQWLWSPPTQISAILLQKDMILLKD